MNEFDQFAKKILKAKHYFRYCDDFIIVHSDKNFLEGLIPKITMFLKEELELTLHPHKVEIRKVRQGIDFLGYVSLPYTRVIRTKTKRRVLRKITLAQYNLEKEKLGLNTYNSMITSYLGIFSHCQNKQVKRMIEKATKYSVGN